jgi:hypothetical protein
MIPMIANASGSNPSKYLGSDNGIIRRKRPDIRIMAERVEFKYLNMSLDIGLILTLPAQSVNLCKIKTLE